MPDTQERLRRLLASLIIFTCTACSGEAEIKFEALRSEVLTESSSPEPVQVMELGGNFDSKPVKELVFAFAKREFESKKGVCLEFQVIDGEIGLVRPSSYSVYDTLPTLLVGPSDSGSDFLTAFRTTDSMKIEDTFMFRNYFESFTWGRLAIPAKYAGESVWNLKMEESLPLSVLYEVLEELAKNGAKYAILTVYQLSDRPSLHSPKR